VWLKSQGEAEEAEPLYRRALAIREKALGADHPKVRGNTYYLCDRDERE
jgi:hypothetical protein